MSFLPEHLLTNVTDAVNFVFVCSEKLLIDVTEAKDTIGVRSNFDLVFNFYLRFAVNGP